MHYIIIFFSTKLIRESADNIYQTFSKIFYIIFWIRVISLLFASSKQLWLWMADLPSMHHTCTWHGPAAGSWSSSSSSPSNQTAAFCRCQQTRASSDPIHTDTHVNSMRKVFNKWTNVRAFTTIKLSALILSHLCIIFGGIACTNKR